MQGCPHYKGMEGTFCAPSFLTVQEKFFRRKAYVFKCNAAAACQWYGSFCSRFCSDITFSLPLGLLICFGRMSKNPAIRGIVSAYISVMRGTPLMLQLMVVYFGPYFIFGIRISMGYSLIAVFIAFSINYAAYFAEIYRGGIESISAGQYEAARFWDTAKPRHFQDHPAAGDQENPSICDK